MFIISTSTGDKFVEGKEYQGRLFTWDDVPKDIKISSIALTYPFPVTFKNDGESKEISPKVSLNKMDMYYFNNEAVAVGTSNEGGISMGPPVLQAKIIAGIDISRDIVIEIRLDKWGNTSVSHFPYTSLKKQIEKGLFREEIFRKGKD